MLLIRLVQARARARARARAMARASARTSPTMHGIFVLGQVKFMQF